MHDLMSSLCSLSSVNSVDRRWDSTAGIYGGNWTTRGYANSRTGHLTDSSTRRLDNSRTS